MKLFRTILRLTLALLLAAALAVPGCAWADAEEEFAGPFPSWRDLRRDYGAVGDGKTDDTPAL